MPRGNSAKPIHHDGSGGSSPCEGPMRVPRDQGMEYLECLDEDFQQWRWRRRRHQPGARLCSLGSGACVRPASITTLCLSIHHADHALPLALPHESLPFRGSPRSNFNKKT